MMTITLTPEQGQAVEQAGGQPVRVEDPRNHRTYVLVEEDAHERHGSPGVLQQNPLFDIPEGIRQSRPRSSAISRNC
jgi:hypothetical protein